MSDYVDKKKFTEELGKWSDEYRKAVKDGNDPPRMPEYVGECIYLICNNVGYKHCYINYPFQDDMISDAIENCIRYVKNFNIKESKNAYGYVTMIAVRAFHRRIQKEKKNFHNQINYLRDVFNDSEIRNILVGDGDHDYKTYMDNFQDILDTFDDIPYREVKEKKKKSKMIREKIIEEKGDEYE